MLDKVQSLGSSGAGKAFSLFEEFKAFAFKGNIVDLAVGVVIGAAFGKVITSLVDHIIMPLVGMLPLGGGGGYRTWVIPLPGGSPLPIGLFLAEILSFIILAFAIFIVFKKIIEPAMRSKKDAPPPPPTKDQELLMEIRDLLKAQAGK